MEITITPAGMKALETSFMLETGMPGALLMEHAAQGVVSALGRHTHGCVLFLCGLGNNGGDGYAAARLWQAAGHKAIIWELSDHVSGDAALNRLLAQNAGVPIRTLTATLPELPICDVIVDALFGTGLSRDVTGTAAALIHLANASGLPILAVDIPSGLDGLTGEVRGCCTHAAETVTFHRPKPGLLQEHNAGSVGKLTVCPILIPADYGDQSGLLSLTPDDLPRLIPPRPLDAHKGSMGRIVIFAGSTGMAGAAAFAANAAMKTGAGLTNIQCRSSLLPVIQILAPGATCTVLPEANGRLTPDAAALAEHALKQADAAAVGCGLGQSDDALPLLTVFKAAACPVVWDADALNLLASHPALLPLKPADIITPHPGEAARLLGCSVREVTDHRADALASLHARIGCHVLLKGARTLMTDGSQVAVNRFGTPAMAKGGSGDVLTGILAALMARDLPSVSTLTRMQIAALVHGLAGIRSEQTCGENGVTASDLIQALRLLPD